MKSFLNNNIKRSKNSLPVIVNYIFRPLPMRRIMRMCGGGLKRCGEYPRHVELASVDQSWAGESIMQATRGSSLARDYQRLSSSHAGRHIEVHNRV
jgi:hypothetical protein